MRTNYDFVKTENKKLNDSLDTQHKLWKVWLEKMDVKKDKSVPVTKSNEESTKVNEVEIIEDDGVDTEEDQLDLYLSDLNLQNLSLLPN